MLPGRRYSQVLAIALLALCLFGYQNCGLSQPSVDASDSTVSYNHTGLEQTCISCHAGDRPAPAGTILHGNNADCVSCHTSLNNSNLSTDVAWSQTSSTYSHTAGLTSCINCHAPNRPSPINNFPHFANNDCSSCHNPNGNNTDGLEQTQIDDAWFNTAAYTHPSGQTTCISCHLDVQPASPHVQGQDCVSCHTTSDAWTQSTTNAEIQNQWNQNTTN